MGASQSTAGAGAAGGSVEVKTSYYELLGVERTATDEEIKRAYRRKALELHPDRNYGDSERTTALFAEIQTAYEVLSDPQERAWYDAHEGDILRGGEGGGDEHYEYNMRVTTADDIARMMGKFRGNVDFSDSPTGFFGFVRETFEQLAREEEHAANYEGVEVPDYPLFGHKDDTYEDVVRTFYAAWNGFATVKTFAWMDVYRLSDAPDRRVRRLMEKENKKFREEGISQFNDAVRTLVAFVRKRDPRYTPNRQTAEEAAKAQREARKAQAARSRAAHAAKIQQDAVPEWAKVRDPEESEEETEEEVEEEHYECVACRKTFKSERQYDAHEKSKKHQKAVAALKRKMQKDNVHLNLDEDVTSSGVMTPLSDGEALEEAVAIGSRGPDSSVQDIADEVAELKVEDEESTDNDRLETHSNDSDAEPTTQRQPQTSTANASTPSDEEEDDDDDDEYASRSDVEARLASFRKPTSAPDIHNETPSPEPTFAAVSDSENPPPTDTNKKLGKAAQKRAKKAAKQAEMDQPDMKHRCATCKAEFPSKNQLWQHIKDFKHAAPVAVTKGGGGGGGGGPGKKGKRK